MRATYYTLTSADDPLPGLSWTLEGRSGNGAWTLLDQRREQAFPSGRQLRPFRIERPGDYGEYRLRLEAPAGMALAEVELLQPVRRQAIP